MALRIKRFGIERQTHRTCFKCNKINLLSSTDGAKVTALSSNNNKVNQSCIEGTHKYVPSISSQVPNVPNLTNYIMSLKSRIKQCSRSSAAPLSLLHELGHHHPRTIARVHWVAYPTDKLTRKVWRGRHPPPETGGGKSDTNVLSPCLLDQY